MPVCMIFGAGEMTPKDRITMPSDGDLIIAADGGLLELTECLPGVKPDIFLGDLDSINGEVDLLKHFCEKNGITMMKHPVEKDDTDMGLAVMEGASRGYREFYLYGGTGGRWDHTIANCQLLASIAAEGGRGFLVGPGLTATVITADGSSETMIRIDGREGGTLSVFSASDLSEGVCIEGAYYKADNVTLTNRFSLGVSNHFTKEAAVVRLRKGILLIVGDYLPADCRSEEAL